MAIPKKVIKRGATNPKVRAMASKKKRKTKKKTITSRKNKKY